MQTEYIIWGKAPGTDFEDLLVSEQAGIRDRAQADRICAVLADKHGCRDLRITAFSFGDGSEVAAMFRNTVGA
jgi:hypothetical protein